MNAIHLQIGGFLIGRTLAVLVTVTLATSMAAREGPIQMAGYQICLEIWLALSLLNDALALAGQVSAYTLLIKAYFYHTEIKRMSSAQNVLSKLVEAF